MAYDATAARELLRRSGPNLVRWHESAHACRTDASCNLGAEGIELAIARALESAYQDGRRAGELEQRRAALLAMISQAESIESQMGARLAELRRDLVLLEDLARTFKR